MSTKVQKINLLLPSEYVSRLDELAKKEYRTRSEVIRELIRDALGAQDNPMVEERLKLWHPVKGLWRNRKGIHKQASSWRRSITQRLLPA